MSPSSILTNRRGRLAPSPTGAQHVGNARTYLAAWLSARLQGAAVHLRIEDLDSPRVKAWATTQVIEDLRWLGLDWDPAESPEVADPLAPDDRLAGVWCQTSRESHYHRCLRELAAAGRLYPCDCSRKEVEQSASAPHLGEHRVRYPDTCRHRRLSTIDEELVRFRQSFRGEAVERDGATESRSIAWRFRCSDREQVFDDAVVGRQRAWPHRELGDFVIARRHGPVAYQLAVVVDDHQMQITEVVRGDDLIPSTFWQLEIYQALGWSAPQFCHLPLVVGPDGRRLAKRHGDTRLSEIRQRGQGPERLLGVLAASCGWLPEPELITAAELLDRLRTQFAAGERASLWQHLPRTPYVLTPATWQYILGPRV